MAKAYADLITIAGYDGGTAPAALFGNTLAARRELGLVEAAGAGRQRSASQIRLRRWTAVTKTTASISSKAAAILGAESFLGFGTGPVGLRWAVNTCASAI